MYLTLALTLYRYDDGVAGRERETAGNHSGEDFEECRADDVEELVPSLGREPHPPHHSSRHCGGRWLELFKDGTHIWQYSRGHYSLVECLQHTQ